MKENENYNTIFKTLIEGEQNWQLVPADSLTSLSTEYEDLKEVYFTNKEPGTWSEIADKSVQKTTFIVGTYFTRYYFDEDAYTTETNYFFGFITKISEVIQSKDCITISDSDFTPVMVSGGYKLIKDLFDKVKTSTINFEDILNDL